MADIVWPEELLTSSPVLTKDLQILAESLVEEWKLSDALLEVGVSPTRSALIYGQPETGMTHLPLWIAGQLGMPVVFARLDCFTRIPQARLNMATDNPGTATHPGKPAHDNYEAWRLGTRRPGEEDELGHIISPSLVLLDSVIRGHEKSVGLPSLLESPRRELKYGATQDR